MHDAHEFFRSLTIVLAVAALVTVVFQRLRQPVVLGYVLAGVIVGTRLGAAEHRQDNARVFAVTLDTEDQADIDAVLAKARDLYRLIGDCGDEYRR